MFGKRGDCDINPVASVRLVVSDMAGEPRIIAQVGNCVVMGREGRGKPGVVLAVAIKPFGHYGRLKVVGWRLNIGRCSYCNRARVEKLNGGIDAVGRIAIDATVVPREQVAVRGREAVGDGGDIWLDGDASWEGIGEG